MQGLRLLGSSRKVIIFCLVLTGASLHAAVDSRALLDKYCVTCHNQKAKTAGLMLDKMDVTNVAPGAEVWEKVIQKIRGGMMPPLGMPRPDRATTDAFLTSLENQLDQAYFAKVNPGRVGLHRLNRA